MNQLDLTEEQQDCLQELFNVSMGQASDQLARYLDTFVFLKIPSIEQVNASSLTETLISDEKILSVVSQGFFGYEGIRGEALLIFQPKDSNRLAEMLGVEPEDLSEEEQLIDISSILTTTFLNGFAAQIENQMSYNAPRLITSGNSSLTEHLDTLSFDWDMALKVNITYQATDYSFQCDMILLIPESAIKNIKTVVDRILDEF